MDQVVLVLSVGVSAGRVVAVEAGDVVRERGGRRAKSSGSGAQWPQVAAVDQAGEDGRGGSREGIVADAGVGVWGYVVCDI